MGLIQDVGEKLAQGFLSMDDLVLGKGLISEGLSQLGLTGRTLAGTAVASANLAVRAVHGGVQAGAKTAAATAAALEDYVPGAGMARALARRLDEESAAGAEEASRLASHAVELTGGQPPRNPLTGEEWLTKSTPRGYSWSELAADTAVGSLGRLATLPLTLGLEAAAAMASSRAGRAAVDSALAGTGTMLEVLPGDDNDNTRLDTGEISEALMALTAGSGDSASRGAVALGEAAVRFSMGDSRMLRQAIEGAIEEMRRIAGHTEMSDLLPAVPISAALRQRARRVVEHAPEKLLQALERGPGGEAPATQTVLSAMLDDADNLRVFATEYPLALALMGTQAGIFLTAGMADAAEVESYLQDDGDGDGDDDDDATTARPSSATQLENILGQAPDGAYGGTAVGLAQDTAFLYASEVLGRDKALERTERLHGRDARERLEDDLSLDLDILRAEPGEERDALIRDHVAASGERALTRQRDSCQEQLAALEAFAGTLYGYRPKVFAERRDVLRTFLSLTHQHLALRGAEDGRAATAKARESFGRWLETVA